eukprot:1960589-Rhodomonas_salina.1
MCIRDRGRREGAGRHLAAAVSTHGLSQLTRASPPSHPLPALLVAITASSLSPCSRVLGRCLQAARGGGGGVSGVWLRGGSVGVGGDARAVADKVAAPEHVLRVHRSLHPAPPPHALLVSRRRCGGGAPSTGRLGAKGRGGGGKGVE